MNVFRFDARRIALIRSLIIAVSVSWAACGTVSAAQQIDSGAFLQTVKDADLKSEAGQWSEAAALWEQAAHANPVNPRYWQQWGTALDHMKKYSEAIAAHQKALELGPNGFPWSVSYDIARDYALLGDKQQALAWLDKSWKLGWRDLDRARNDDAFGLLLADPHFRELTASIDPATLGRDGGWRYDLHLLAREIERRQYAPFRDIPQVTFESAVARVDSEIPHLTDNQIAVRLMKLLAMVGDGHTIETFFFNAGPPQFRQNAPVQFYLFDDSLFIIGAELAHRDLVGSQVLRIGGHTVAEVMNALETTVPHDNAMRLKSVAPTYMRNPAILNGLGLLPAAGSLPLTLRGLDGKDREIVLQTEDLDAPQYVNGVLDHWVSLSQLSKGPVPLYLKHPKVPYWFEYLPDQKVLYFQFNLILDANDERVKSLIARHLVDPGTNETLKTFLGQVFSFAREHEIDKMVIDMRNNSGGNTFLAEPLIQSLIRAQNVDQRGKLFVIIGRRTFSAAMNTADFLERHTQAIFVGEPTGSSPNFIGETARLTLPYSKLAPSLSDLFWESSWPMDHRAWIAPLLYAPPTFTAARDNRDPAMEAILAYPRCQDCRAGTK